MTNDSQRDALRDVALFKDLPDSDLATLSQQVAKRRYARNEVMFLQGDPGDGLYMVTSGHVTIGRQGADGTELIIGVYGSGEYFGELSLFDDEPRSATATVIEEAEALFLSRSGFRTFVEKHPAAILQCLEVVMGQLRRCTDIAHEIALLDVRSRLARRLLTLAGQGILEGEPRGPQSGHGAFHITQGQLASMVGTTRESVNKHLHTFAEAGLLRLNHGDIHILDPNGLRSYTVGLI